MMEILGYLLMMFAFGVFLLLLYVVVFFATLYNGFKDR
jgi:hypothetical protein